jgi:DNA-binding CsgD family transcriptional regulator
MTLLERDTPISVKTRSTVAVDVTETTLRLALSYVLDDDHGWARVPAGEPSDLVVADRVMLGDGSPPLDVLVVLPLPALSQQAVHALAEGRVRAVLDASQPDQLPTTLRALDAGLSVLPTAVVEAANDVPVLNDRLGQTLHLVLSGASNRTIARALHESESTAKRDVGDLLRMFDARNRVGLVSTASRLGYRSRRLL